MNNRRIDTITIQMKYSDNDWRGFVSCYDENNTRWELRAYGTSPQDVFNDCMKVFNEDDWDIVGYTYHE